MRHYISELVEEGESAPIAYIGRKPFLRINGSSISDFQIPGEENVLVFEGLNEVCVQSNNFIADNLIWEIYDTGTSNDNLPEILIHPNDARSKIIRINKTSYGRKWNLKAKSQCGGESASMNLLFLPSLQDEGVLWNPIEECEEVRFRNAYNTGLEIGTISFSGGSIVINRPVNTPLWSWRNGLGSVRGDYNKKKQFLNHKKCDFWQLEVVLPSSGNWHLKFNNEVLENCKHLTIRHLIGERIGPQELEGDKLGAEDFIQFVNDDNPAEFFKVASIQRLPAHPVVGILNEAPQIYIHEEFKNNQCRLFLFRESGLLDDTIHEVTLMNFHVPGIHKIEGLPEFKCQEGAWLILAETSRYPELPIESLTLLGSILRNIDIYGICEIASEGEAQTFSELLKIWIGEDEKLTEKKRSEIRSRLDILHELFRHINAEHGVDKILSRARSFRETFGYGNHLEVKNYFASQLGQKLHGNKENIASLFDLLLQCGFNWLSEGGWIESLHESAKTALTPGSRYTKKMKELINEACPLLEAFELTHRGACSGIPNIEECFFVHPHNQAEIGLMVASPNSDVPAYKNGFHYRGVVPAGMKLDRLNAAPRRIHFPGDYRNPVELMDTRGDYCPIILKVTDSLKAARYFEDHIAGEQNLRLDEEFKNRIKDIFLNSIKMAAPLLGSFDDPKPDETQLGRLLKACNDNFEKMSEETFGQESRSVIFQAAVLCRLHAWLAKSKYVKEWPLHSPKTYDCVCSLAAHLWKNPVLRKALIKDIVPIEWLITWFKSPKFNN